MEQLRDPAAERELSVDKFLKRIRPENVFKQKAFRT